MKQWLKGLGMVALFLIGLVLFVWLNYRLMTQVDYPNIDFGYFYAGGRVLIQGGDPYNVPAVEAIYETMGRTRYDPLVKAFPYPLYADFIFAPFALFSLEWATTWWTIFNEICFGLTFWLLSSTLLLGQKGYARQQGLQFLLVWTLLFFIPSRHFVKALLNGQTSFLTTLLVALFIYAQVQKRYELAGLALLVGLFKPTSFMLLLPLALLWLLPSARRRGWYSFIGGSLVLALPAFLLNFNWINGWLAARTGEGWQIVQRIATVWGTSSALTGMVGMESGFWVLAIIIAGALLFGTWYFSRKLPALQHSPVLSWGIIATLSIYLSLYAFSYESVVLLIPLMGLLELIRHSPHRQKTLGLVGLAVLLLGVPWLLFPLGTPLDEISAGLFPLSMILFSWLVAAQNRNQTDLPPAKTDAMFSAKVVGKASLK